MMMMCVRGPEKEGADGLGWLRDVVDDYCEGRKKWDFV